MVHSRFKELILIILRLLTSPLNSVMVKLHHERLLVIIKTMYAKKYASVYDSKILAGQYLGLKLPSNLEANRRDFMSIIIGNYEKGIIDVITTSKFSTFVNIGSGDGVHLNGIAKLFPIKKCIGYEIDKKSIANSLWIREQNNIENVEMRGPMTCSEMKHLAYELRDVTGLILCDIEGQEYEIFTSENLSLLTQCTIIIELHEFSSLNQGQARNLISVAANFFDVQIMKHRGRIIESLEVLTGYSDDLFMLFHSESRPSEMRYLILRPRVKS